MNNEIREMRLEEVETTQNQITSSLSGVRKRAILIIIYHGFSGGLSQAEIRIKEKKVLGDDLVAVSANINGLQPKVFIKRTQHSDGDCTIWRITIPQYSLKDAVIVAVLSPNQETLSVK